MKTLPTIAGLLLAGTFATAAQAGPSKGAIMTMCKSEIKENIEDVSRIRTAKFRTKASGTHITFKVSTTDAEATRVTCTYKDGLASLEGEGLDFAVVEEEIVLSGN